MFLNGVQVINGSRYILLRAVKSILYGCDITDLVICLPDYINGNLKSLGIVDKSSVFFVMKKIIKSIEISKNCIRTMTIRSNPWSFYTLSGHKKRQKGKTKCFSLNFKIEQNSNIRKINNNTKPAEFFRIHTLYDRFLTSGSNVCVGPSTLFVLFAHNTVLARRPAIKRIMEYATSLDPTVARKLYLIVEREKIMK